MTETKPLERLDLSVPLSTRSIDAPAIVTGEELPRRPPEPLPMGGGSPLDRITELLNRGITLDTLDQFLEMQAKWEARESEKAYLRAMAAFKSEGVGEILKSAHVHYKNKDGRVVDYWHEELADVVAAVLPVMARYGLSHSWRPIQDGRGEGQLITVRTVVTHTGGHSESVELYAAPDGSGSKNSIQAIKSTVSYLERIGLLAILGLAAKGQDVDGRSGGDDWHDEPSRAFVGDPEPPRPRGKPDTRPPQSTDQGPASSGPPALVTDKQVGLLVARLQGKGLDRADLCQVYGIPGLEDLPRDRMDEALKWIGQQR